jgi:hypothetical protein
MTTDATPGPARPRGPEIWLAGEPAELAELLPRGACGIVTNTVIFAQLAPRHGGVRGLLEAYLALGPYPVIVEVDGDTAGELLRWSEAACSLSPRVGIKLPTRPVALEAMRRLAAAGVTVFATTVASVAQAAAVAACGVSHLCPFVRPLLDRGEDAYRVIGEIVAALRPHAVRPRVIAGLIRDAAEVHASLSAGADGVVIFTGVYRAALVHPVTEQWNATFRAHWDDLLRAGALDGLRAAGVARA